MKHETKLTSEISFPSDSCLAQSVEHWNDDLEVVISIPSRGNILFCSSPSSWQDLATEIMNYAYISPMVFSVSSLGNLSQILLTSLNFHSLGKSVSVFYNLLSSGFVDRMFYWLDDTINTWTSGPSSMDGLQVVLLPVLLWKTIFINATGSNVC